MRLWLALLLLLPLATARGQTSASAPIQRCTGANGQLIFTDRNCADLQAVPAMPAPATATNAYAATADALPPILCATDIAELKQAVVDAFAARDANRLAGLMLWNGHGRNSVVAEIRLLQGLMEHPLLDLETPSSGRDAADPTQDDIDPPASAASSRDAAAAPAAPTTLVLHTAAIGGGTHETHLGLLRHAGCLWLRPLE